MSSLDDGEYPLDLDPVSNPEPPLFSWPSPPAKRDPADELPAHDGRNAADARQIEVQTKIVRERDAERARDLAKCLGIPECRRLLVRILEMTGVQAISPADPWGCQRSEGARSVGIEIAKMLTAHSLTAYPALLMEAAQDSIRYEKERQAMLAAAKERQRTS